MNRQNEIRKEMVHIPRAWIFAILIGYIHFNNFGLQVIFWLSFFVSPILTLIWYILGLVTLQWRINEYHRNLARKYKLSPLERLQHGIKV